MKRRWTSGDQPSDRIRVCGTGVKSIMVPERSGSSGFGKSLVMRAVEHNTNLVGKRFFAGGGRRWRFIELPTAAARDAVKKEALRKAGIGYHEVERDTRQ